MVVPSLRRLLLLVALAARPDWLPAGGRDHLALFPPLAECEAACAEAARWRDVYRGRAAVAETAERRQAFAAAAAEFHRRWDVWDDLRLAHRARQAACRLNALFRLRSKVTRDEWDWRQLPPPTPE